MSRRGVASPFVRCRGFLWIGSGPRYGRPTEWQAAQKRLREPSWFGTSILYVTAKPRYRYWISYARNMGRVHIATGRAIRTISDNRFAEGIVVQLYCGSSVSYARGIETADAAPGFTLCPRCIDAAYKETAA